LEPQSPWPEQPFAAGKEISAEQEGSSKTLRTALRRHHRSHRCKQKHAHFNSCYIQGRLKKGKMSAAIVASVLAVAAAQSTLVWTQNEVRG
jgi:hypothetical protein